MNSLIVVQLPCVVWGGTFETIDGITKHHGTRSIGNMRHGDVCMKLARSPLDNYVWCLTPHGLGVVHDMNL